MRTAFLIWLQRVSTRTGLVRACSTYLSTVQIAPGKSIIVIGREFINLNAATDSLDLAEEGFPDTILSFGGEFAIAERNVDAGLEGRIEGFDPVRRQEEDALEVFQEPKEDADKCISGNILGLASLCRHTSAKLST